MSAEFPMFIFVGDAARHGQLSTAASDRGWHVYEGMEDPLYGTLAQVVAFFPDAVVIDAESAELSDAVSHEIVMHLQSINYEPLILLSDNPQIWDIETGARMVILPSHTPTYEILDAVRALLADTEPAWA